MHCWHHTDLWLHPHAAPTHFVHLRLLPQERKCGIQFSSVQRGAAAQTHRMAAALDRCGRRKQLATAINTQQTLLKWWDICQAQITADMETPTFVCLEFRIWVCLRSFRDSVRVVLKQKATQGWFMRKSNVWGLGFHFSFIWILSDDPCLRVGTCTSACGLPLRVCFRSVEQILDPGLLSFWSHFCSQGSLACLVDQAHQPNNPEIKQAGGIRGKQWHIEI